MYYTSIVRRVLPQINSNLDRAYQTGGFLTTFS